MGSPGCTSPSASTMAITPALRTRDEIALVVPIEHSAHEARREAVELLAGIAEAGDLDHRRLAEPEPGPGGQREEIQAPGRHVLPHVTGADVEPTRAQFVVQFGADEVHLPEVRRLGGAGHPGTVLDGPPGVPVAGHALARDQPDARHRRLAETVPRRPADRRDVRLRSRDGHGAGDYVTS
jgi:hypothetical protein